MPEKNKGTPPANVVTAPHQPAGTAALRPEHLYKAVWLLFALAVLYRFFDAIAQIFLLIYAASIVAVLLNGLIRWLPLQRTRVAALTGVVVFAALGAAVWFGLPALFEQGRNLVQRIPEFEAQLRAWGVWIREQTGFDIELVSGQTADSIRGFLAGFSGQDVLVGARGLIQVLLVPLIILFGALFAVANPNEYLLSPLLRAVPRDRRLAVRRMFNLLGERLLGWVLGTLIAMVVVGTISTVTFYLIGVPNALFLGSLNGVLEAVPLLGAWVGGIITTLVAFMDDPTKGLITAIAVLVIQQVEANIILPYVMSKAAEVHPFITLFSLVLFGTLFGFLGILLAIPLVLLVWTAVQVLWVERAIDTDEDPIEPVVEE